MKLCNGKRFIDLVSNIDWERVYTADSAEVNFNLLYNLFLFNSF